jgi:rod shape-determining protein MreD
VRWPIYFILAYLAAGLQLGLGDYLSLAGARPNLMLIAAVFIAINAPRDAALLGCFALGVMQDLLTLDRLGLHGLAYGVFAMMASGQATGNIRTNAFAHFLFALVGGLVTAMVMLSYSRIHGPSRSIGVELWGALYTALLAPLVIWALNRLRSYFSFEPARRRYVR